MNQNDVKICELIDAIDQKIAAISGEASYDPKTSCHVTLDGNEFNLRVPNMNHMARLKLYCLKVGADCAKMDPDSIRIGNYSLSTWIQDCDGFFKAHKKSIERDKLRATKRKLQKLLSADCQTESQIADIAKELGL